MRTILSALAFSVLAACGSSSPKPEPGPGPGDEEPTPAGACVTGGCSGTLCEDEGAEPMATTCEWREEYACYQTATCERQADGACGWTETDELTACLADPPAAE